MALVAWPAGLEDASLWLAASDEDNGSRSLRLRIIFCKHCGASHFLARSTIMSGFGEEESC
jgi:hypothetical protein